MLKTTHFIGITLLLMVTFLAAIVEAQTSCTTDDDCQSLNAAIPGDKANRPGAYMCMLGQCRFESKAGSMCYRASDCAAYSYYARALANNESLSLFPPSAQSDPIAYMETLCGSEYCSIYTCDTATQYLNSTNPPPLPGVTTSTFCCSGIQTGLACEIEANDLDPCQTGTACTINPETPDSTALTCVPLSARGSTTWIGVVIACVAAVLTNIGLNMQKYALRKRLEKQERDAELELLEKRLELTAEDLVIRRKPKGWNKFKSKMGTMFRRSSQALVPSTASLDDAMTQNNVANGSNLSNLSNLSNDVETEGTVAPPIITDRKRLASGPYEFKIITENPTDASELSPSLSPNAQSTTRVRISISDERERTATALSTELAPPASPRLSTTVRTSFHFETSPEVEHIDASKEAKRLTASLDVISLIKTPMWLFGFLLFVGANLGNFVSLRFAPQSIIAPLGAVALVANVIIAPLMNKEKWSWTDIVGIILIVGGCVMVVVFGGSQEAEYPLCVLLALFRQPATIAFLTIVIFFIVLIYVLIQVVEKNLIGNCTDVEPTPMTMEEIQSIEFLPEGTDGKGVKLTSNGAEATMWVYNDDGTRTPRPTSLAVPEPIGCWQGTKTWFSKTFEPLTIWWAGINVIPRFAKPIGMNSVVVRWILPFTYASIGGLLGTLTVLFAKATVNLLSLSISGWNQYDNFTAWAITIFTIWSAFAQTWFINRGLQRYDALLQVPVYFTIWTTADVIGGALLFQEFSHSTPLKISLFCLGVVIIFTGVGVLARRLSRIQVDENNLNAAVESEKKTSRA
jgi:hypothetical protein